MSRRLDLCAADEVPPGTMKMCEVDDELVLVTNLGGTFHATQGVCTHEYFEPDGRIPYLRAPPVALLAGGRRAPGPAG